MKYDLAILQKKLDKVTEEKNIFQEKNRELTKNVRKERSSSLSSPTGSTNNSCDSLSNLSQKKTFADSLRKGAKNIFPTKGNKDKVTSDASKGKKYFPWLVNWIVCLTAAMVKIQKGNFLLN